MKALALALAALVLLPGCIRQIEDAHYVSLTRIDVSAPTVTSGTVVLAVNATLDNRGADSGAVALVVKAFDTATGLLTLTNSTPASVVPGDRTVTREVRMPLPRASGYRIEVTVMEDEQAVQFGQVQVSNVQALPPNLHETGLRIGSMDFLVRNTTGGRARIEAKVYVTNEGTGPVTTLRMQVKAREVSTGLLADERATNVSGVGLEETKAFPVTLDVPGGYNYEVEAILWDRDFVVGRGSGHVQLLPTFTKDKDTEIVVTNPVISDFVRGDARGEAGAADRSYAPGVGPSYEGGYAEPSVPGPGALAAVVAVALAAFLLARRRS